MFNGLAARINLDLAVSLDTGRTFKTIATLASSKENNRYHIEPSVLIDSNKVLVTYSSSLSISPNLYELIKKELTFSELEILEMSVNTSPLNSTFSQSFGFGTGGKVGVGTANPLVKFVVSNNGAQGLEIDPASSQIEIASYNRLNRAYFPTRFSASSFKYSIAGSSSVLTIASNGNIGIKDETPSAPLTITSTLGGVLFPRLTQTQVTAVVSPVGGTVLFNTTTSKLQVFTGSAWVDLH